MKEFKGTPAPWEKRVTSKGAILAVIPRRLGKRVIETTLQLGKIDYSDECSNPSCCCQEEHANAQLIAAAPDLLEAAQHCREVIERASFTEENRKRAISALSQLNAAISKALTHS